MQESTGTDLEQGSLWWTLPVEPSNIIYCVLLTEQDLDIPRQWKKQALADLKPSVGVSHAL